MRVQDLGAARADSGTVWVVGVGWGEGQGSQRPVQHPANSGEGWIGYVLPVEPSVGLVGVLSGGRGALSCRGQLSLAWPGDQSWGGGATPPSCPVEPKSMPWPLG